MEQNVYIGTIFMFAGSFAPLGFQLCNGQLLSISSNAALFSILGTTYGGNGVQTFGLPDLRGRAPIHAGQGPELSNFTLGEIGGTENATLLLNNMPMHTHNINATSAIGDKTTPAGNIPAALTVTAQEKLYSNAAANTTMSPTMVATAGGNAPFSIQQPYLAVNFIIATTGIFPSRN